MRLSLCLCIFTIVLVFNLVELLDQTENGIELCSYYDTHNDFLPHHRKELVRIIVDHLVSIDKPTTVSGIEEIGVQISLVFRKEDKVQ